MDAVWAALQDSSFAALVRNSTFIYPIANVTHVVAVIAFFGVVATMDLQLLRGASSRVAITRLRPLALLLLLAVAAAGFILFSAEAVALARNPAFQVKLAAIALALLNIAVNEWSQRSFGENNFGVRYTAGFSLFIWLFIAAMGRTIAYI